MGADHDHSRAPKPESYRFVLRKLAEHDPTIEERVSGYDESALSVDVTHRDGVRRRTIFISSENFRDRLLRLGWEDVTQLFAGELPPATQAAPEAAAAPVEAQSIGWGGQAKGRPPKTIRVAG
jgi:hypothetical protein